MNSKHIKPIMQVFAIIMLVTLMGGLAPGAVRLAYALTDQAALTVVATPSIVIFGGVSNLSTKLGESGSGTGGLTFAVSGSGNGCSVTPEGILTVTNASLPCSVTATKAGDGTYNAATSAPLSVTLQKADQAALTAVAAPSTVAYGSTSTLSNSGGSGTGAVTYSHGASTGCSVSGSTLSVIIPSGTCAVTATKAADNNYNLVTSGSLSVGLSKASQTSLIVVAAPSTVTYGSTSTLSSSGGSGTGVVTYSHGASGGCSVSGSTLSVTNASLTCAVTATKATDTNYNAATSDPLSVVLSKANQAISITSIAPTSTVAGVTTYTPTATGGGSGNAVVFTIDGTTASICTITSGVVSFQAAGNCVIDANQAANTNYNAATQIQQSITVTVLKVMTAFSITSPEVTGVITESTHTIAVTVPFGTDVTALAARFTSTGVSVKIGSTTQVSGTNLNNFTSPVTYRVIAVDASYQDYTVTVTIAPSPMKSIISFGFVTPSAKGAMTGPDGTIIKVTVPFGTNVAALVASFTTTGASVKVGTVTQVSGTTVVNFTSPVTYTVTAANASTKTYSVIVTVAGKSTKEITAFSFPGQAATGVFNGTDIAVTVPNGTNLRTLVATFTTTGSRVKVGATTQVSGTTKTNFSIPVIYTVIAEDGSKQTYRVKVTVAPKIIKFITAFSFTNPAATGVITEAKRTIAVTVPFGTDVTALVASFTTTDTSPMVGTTAQISGTTPNNFSGTVSYKLSDTKIYKVTVKVAASPAKDMTAFSFSKQAAIGVISGTNITVTVPAGTNVKALVARFSTTGASVKVGALKQVSGTSKNNFTRPVLYRVIAADGSSQIYTVTVTVAPNSTKDITTFSFTSPSATGVITGTNIAVTVPSGTNITALVANFTATGASVKIGAKAQISGTTANNFTNPAIYRVTAIDASTQDYTVTVTVAINPANKDITAFSFGSPAATGMITGTSIAVTVPFGTNVSALVASFTTTGASVKIGASVQTSGTTPNNFISPLTYRVTAADASTQDYIVTVTVAANPAKDITAFSFTSPSATGVITGTNIVLMVPFGTSPFGLVANFTTTGGSVKVGSMSQTSGITANNFTSPVVYRVTAADASTQDYTVTVIVAPN